MAQIENVLTENEQKALAEIKTRTEKRFKIRSFILFGSKARGEALADSDIDLLLVTDRELSHEERHQISHDVFSVNIEFGTLYSFITISETEWNSPIHRYYPIHTAIERDGIPV